MAAVAGAIAHTVVLARLLAAQGWRVGEYNAWQIFIADIPVSRAYFENEKQLLWGSLIVGTLFWTVAAVGLLNLSGLLALAFSAEGRAAVGRELQDSTKRIIAKLFWVVATTVAFLAVLIGHTT